MGKFREIFNRFILKKDNVQIARELGVRIGDDCLILANPYQAFAMEPYLIKLGDHVEITTGCRFITHDGGVWCLRKIEGLNKIDKFGKITVGNNVFIGLQSLIMPGVSIGDNCIIGAGSIVTKSIPSGEVWAGVPARYICSIEQYHEKALRVADFTKHLNAREKKAALEKKHPEWFQDQ